MDDQTPIYIVDDDHNMREWLSTTLADSGLTCRTFATGDAFLASLDQLGEGCLLLDMRMPRVSGLLVQSEMARRGRTMKVIVITGNSNFETVVEALKLGARDVLEKPFTVDALLKAVRAAIGNEAAP